MAIHIYNRQASASEMAVEIDRRGAAIERLEAERDTLRAALAAERAARIEAEGRAEQRREALDEAVEDMRRIASNIDHGISLKLVRIDLNAAANRARAAPSPSNPGDAA